MIISNAQRQDSGRYTCKCVTDAGQQYMSEYELNIEDEPARNEVRPPKVEYAEVGSAVVLRCNADRNANHYHWSRQHGKFAPGQNVTGVSVDIGKK